MVESPTLAHLEKLLAETFRREIEQEEDIWRSLRFFVDAQRIAIRKRAFK